jgi:hypothetical protein
MSRCVCDGFIESSLLGKVFQAVDGYVGLTLQIVAYILSPAPKIETYWGSDLGQVHPLKNSGGMNEKSLVG